jgi:hypothetical protein
MDPVTRPRHASRRLEQLRQHLQAHHSDVLLLDVREPLLEAKKRERIYHVTDSHWNARGGFVGYRELAKALSDWFPAIHPFERPQFAEAVAQERGGDAAGVLDLRDALHEENLKLEPRFPLRARRSVEDVPLAHADLKFGLPKVFEVTDPALPRAVFFHDSFALGLQPMLSEHFRRLVGVWDDHFHPDVVERERPDVVVQELVERKLGILTPDDFDESDDPATDATGYPR